MNVYLEYSVDILNSEGRILFKKPSTNGNAMQCRNTENLSELLDIIAMFALRV